MQGTSSVIFHAKMQPKMACLHLTKLLGFPFQKPSNGQLILLGQYSSPRVSTPLLAASAEGRQRAVELLIDWRAAVDAQDNSWCIRFTTAQGLGILPTSLFFNKPYDSALCLAFVSITLQDKRFVTNHRRPGPKLLSIDFVV